MAPVAPPARLFVRAVLRESTVARTRNVYPSKLGATARTTGQQRHVLSNVLQVNTRLLEASAVHHVRQVVTVLNRGLQLLAQSLVLRVNIR